MLARCAVTERTELDRADAAMPSRMSDLRGYREGHGSRHPRATLLAPALQRPGTRRENLLDWERFDGERSWGRLSQRACQRLEGR